MLAQATRDGWAGQWIASVTARAIRITDWGLFPDWVSSHARLADPIQPLPNKCKSGHSGLPIAPISRLPDWVVQSVLPIAIHRLLHRFYPLASGVYTNSQRLAEDDPKAGHGTPLWSPHSCLTCCFRGQDQFRASGYIVTFGFASKITSKAGGARPAPKLIYRVHE